MTSMRVRALAGIAAASLVVILAFAASRSADVASPAASPTPEASTEAAVVDFVQAHTRTSTVPAGRFAWLLSDVVGSVILPEDEKMPAAVLGSVVRPEVSPSGRHLSWWTNEARGVRQLHVLDTITLVTPRVVLETEVFTKVGLRWSTDEQLVAFPLPERPAMTRIVDLATQGSIDGDSSAIAALPIWRRPAAPAPDPGTSMPRVISRFARPDGSATTYLDFDSSSGGRWFGERVEVATGVRTPVEWSFGGNPMAVIWIGSSTSETFHFDQAPPRSADGRITSDGALWSFRQSIQSPERREAVRAMPYAEYAKSAGSYTPIIPPDLVIYVVAIEVEVPVYFPRGDASCRELFAFIRSDGRSEGSGGGCMGNSWPTDRLPPAFGTPDPHDWSSPKGPPTSGPSTTPSIRR